MGVPWDHPENFMIITINNTDRVNIEQKDKKQGKIETKNLKHSTNRDKN
jgi:hypothetical protein